MRLPWATSAGRFQRLGWNPGWKRLKETRYPEGMRWPFTVFAALVVLAACATPAPYQPARVEDLDEVGYLDHQLAPDEFAVTFLANCQTSRRRAFDFALMRAAEIGVHKGFLYFTIIRRKEDTTVIETGSTSYSFPVGSALFGFSATHHAACPIFTFLVQYFRDRPNRGLDLFHCGETAKVLSDRYSLKPSF